ncbi:M23 family metallopeptidase [Paenibacillus antri]|uniref:M23 family metallopeptidase n=1 Tax=Paenibacillus antri TaxID=2582848 RepID=A0A5R9GA21_9BACL|nr:M23 family metallopeptidase [Paenibacillus antri]TLS48275.1 M23 family metallopeptidase [Paenibacillus antri]
MKKIALALAALLVTASAFASVASAAVYTVKAGDTLWGIATANRMTVSELMTLNGLSTTSLMIGQRLTVPDQGNYVVKAGDTMYGIATRAGIPLKALINANPQLANPNAIWPGLRITVPTAPSKFKTGLFPLAKGTYTPFTNNYADARTWTPDGGAVRTHEGVDIFAPEGTPVYAAADGTILNVGWNTYGGYRLTVKADSATAFYYAHLSKYSQTFVKGGAIKQGQLIGYVGSTGYGPEGTKGLFLPHLHFGIYDITTSTWTTQSPYEYLVWWELNR